MPCPFCMRLCACAQCSIRATDPHVPITCFCNVLSYNNVYECPSKGEGACMASIEEFGEEITHRPLTPYAVCDLHSQTSTPPHFFFTSGGKPCFERGQRQKCLWMQSVASTLLGADVLLRLHAQGLMIILKDGEVDAADKEAINLL